MNDFAIEIERFMELCSEIWNLPRWVDSIGGVSVGLLQFLTIGRQAQVFDDSEFGRSR